MTFAHAFLEAAAKCPAHPAVVSDEGTLTYAELVARARRHAGTLANRGVEPGDVVAHVLPRSERSVIAMIGGWLAGAAIAPMDAEWPRARIENAVGRVSARVVVSREPDGDWLVDDDGAPLTDVVDRNGDDLAYLITTSGSTGAPKVVRVAHRGLVPVLRAQIAAFELGPDARTLWMLSPSFDASLSDVGTALLSGATLVIASREAQRGGADLLRALRSHRITYVDLPPALLATIDPAELPASLRTVVIGGEAAPPARVRAWARRVRMLDVYGPTEATICTHVARCDEIEWTESRLGAPLPFVRQRVEDGELLLGGLSLALGYDDAALEAARFVMRDGERWFRTGDRVATRDDGALVLSGRVDRQRKLAGRLVSPEEIELRLSTHAAVREAAVVIDQAPIAFIVTASEVTDAALRVHVRAALPGWMTPSRFVRLDALPRTTSGKVDLAALGRVPLGRPRDTDPLRASMAEALGGDSVEEDDDFFDLGGDSLAALIFAATATADGLSLPVDAAYRARTPRAMRALASAAPKPIDELRRLADSAVLTSEGGPSVANGDAIVVTGATGFLGRYVVAELARRSDRPLIVLVRGANEAVARRRVAEAFEEAALTLPSRLDVIIGDTSRASFGLGAAVWQRLAFRTGDVVHVAARPSLVESLETLWADNVDGAREATRLANASGARLHHVSTLSVFVQGESAPSVICEDTPLEGSGPVHGGYAQSKWIAEAAVRASCPRARFVRPGLVVRASSGGGRAPRCALSAFLRGLVALGAVPDGPTRALSLDVTPVDHAARAIAALVLHGHDGATYHVAGPAPVPLEALVSALADAGARLDVVSPDELRTRARRAATSSDVSLAFLGAARRMLGGTQHDASDLFLATGRRFDARLAKAVLSPLGIECPAADATLLGRYARLALEGA